MIIAAKLPDGRQPLPWDYFRVEGSQARLDEAAAEPEPPRVSRRAYDVSAASRLEAFGNLGGIRTRRYFPSSAASGA